MERGEEKRFHCDHCGEKISKSLYFEHKKLYYSRTSNTWDKISAPSPEIGESYEDFSFPDHDGTDEYEDASIYDPPPRGAENDDEVDNGSNLDFSMEDEEGQTELWFDDVEDDLEDESSPTNNNLLKVYVMFLLKWQNLFRVSDSAMNVLLRFIAGFFGLLIMVFCVNALKDFVNQLPKNISMAKKLIGISGDNFEKFASCPMCDSIYELHKCTLLSADGSKYSEKCSHIEFPNHPQASRRARCNFQLMKRVRTSAGTTTLLPKRMFCYKSIKEALQIFLKRPDFVSKCEEWRTRKIEKDTLKDIYDGQVWEAFMNPSGLPFLSVPYNFALSINVDWFQSTYSLGAIYTAIQNLPRHERYNTENVVLIGVIPGPKEPKHTMNNYLRPLVDELKSLWEGVIMQCSSGVLVMVRAALICTACDIPASRKVSGFVGFNAYHACSRCLKSFPTAKFGETPDYSGFDRNNWTRRSLDDHLKSAEAYRSAKTAKERKSIERTSGCRYSVLLELPYYDIVRYCIVDPMHNLLLGTAKRMLTVWKATGVIDQSQFIDIQATVDFFITPTDIGRIPGKISSGFSGFTAEQWRNWTLIYSLCCLKDILPHRHYDCWLLFVKSTSMLCRRKITLQELDEADSMLIAFCETFERLYGKECCTINTHLHGHLKECVLDYGPVYSFWLFSFERLNGVLGSYHTNCHDISLQLMRRYMSSEYYNICNWPNEYKDQFSTLLTSHHYQKGSLSSVTLEECLFQSNIIMPLPPVHETALENHQIRELQQLVTAFIGHENHTILILHEKATALCIDGFVVGSVASRFLTTSHVMATHPEHPDKLYLAQIEYFAKLNIKDCVKGVTCTIWTACVTYHYEHDCKVRFGGPTQVWSKSTSPDMYYIKLSCIKTRVAYCERSVDFGRRIGTQSVLVVSLLSK